MEVKVNTKVHHKDYGDGVVTKITDDKLYAVFSGKQRIFPYPQAFDKGYLLLIDEASNSPSIKQNEIISPSTEIVNNREIIIDASKNIRYEKIYKAINETVGSNYTAWMTACWPSVYPKLPFRIWFLRLAGTKNGVLVPFKGGLNTISEDWNEVVFDDLRDAPNNDQHDLYPGITLIFAKEPRNGPYIFRGAFINDKDKTTPMHHVAKRIGTKIKLIGKPAADIEILDDFRNK